MDRSLFQTERLNGDPFVGMPYDENDENYPQRKGFGSNLFNGHWFSQDLKLNWTGIAFGAG
jgi:hypothetical protein